MKLSSKNLGRTAIAGVCAITIGGAAVLIVNAVSSNDSHSGNYSSAESEPVRPSDCDIEPLPLPPTANGGTVLDVDPTGTFVVGYFYSRNTSGHITTEPVIWQDGELTDPVDLSEHVARLESINSDGIAVGTVNEPADDDRITPSAYLFFDGKSVKLEDDFNSQGNGINEHGVSVGSMDHPETNVGQAAIFTDDGSEFLEVPDESYFSRAFDIDDDGTIIGVIEDLYPYRWSPNGEGEALTLHDEDDNDMQPVATTISNGRTVGFAGGSDGSSVAVLWERDETEGTIVEMDDVRSINAEGWLAGANGENATIYIDEEWHELPRLSEDSNTEYRATGLSDDGRIIAGDIRLKDTEEATGEAVLWTCG